MSQQKLWDLSQITILQTARNTSSHLEPATPAYVVLSAVSSKYFPKPNVGISKTGISILQIMNRSTGGKINN